ncbi:MAG: glycosyltransferase family 4 protein [bacterium]|nr:glycosyltransferase family 4 protein [bacterium]
MKICLLSFGLGTKDGGGRFAHDLALSLRKSGHEVYAISEFNLLRNTLFRFFTVRKIFKKSDIIHTIDIWPIGFYAKIISLGLNKPIVISSLGTYSVMPLYSWRRPLAIWTAKKAQIVAISEYTKQELNKVMPALDIKALGVGFNFDFWSGKEVRLQEFPEVGLHKPYILSVGAIKIRKGFPNSIRAFAIIAKKIKNLNYIIIGQVYDESEYMNGLKKIVKENNLEDRVFFISSAIEDNELLNFYRNAELFVLVPIEDNHRFEGFGTVYLEAAASGLPIVATFNSGAISAIQDGYSGILVAQNDPEETAEAIIKILSDSAMKEKFKTNSYERVKDFDWEKIVEKYLAIYSEKIQLSVPR